VMQSTTKCTKLIFAAVENLEVFVFGKKIDY
jgi:hypothetical protein